MISDFPDLYIRTKKAVSIIDENRPYPNDVLDLSSGDSLVAGYPSHVFSTFSSDIARYHLAVPFEKLHLELKKIFIEKYSIPENISKNITIGHGATSLFNSYFLYLKLKKRKGSILIPKGHYFGFSQIVDTYGFLLETPLLHKINSFKLSGCHILDYIERNKQRKKPPLICLIIIDPSFIGEIYEENEIKEICEIADAYKFEILIDAVFREYIYDKNKRNSPSFSTFSPSHVTTFTSFSKTRGAPDLRFGFGCGPIETISELNYFQKLHNVCISQESQAKAYYIAKAPDKFIDIQITELKNRFKEINHLVKVIESKLRRKFVKKAIQSNSIHEEYIKNVNNSCMLYLRLIPQAGFTIVLNFEGFIGLRSNTGVIIDDRDIYKYIYETCSVRLSPGYSMGFDIPSIYACLQFAPFGLDRNISLSRKFENRLLRSIFSSFSSDHFEPEDVEIFLSNQKNLLESFIGELSVSFEKGFADLQDFFENDLFYALGNLIDNHFNCFTGDEYNYVFESNIKEMGGLDNVLVKFLKSIEDVVLKNDDIFIVNKLIRALLNQIKLYNE